MSEHAGKHFPRPTAETQPWWDACRESRLLLQRWIRLPMERPKCPNVEAWFERLCARPAFQPHGRDGPP